MKLTARHPIALAASFVAVLAFVAPGCGGGSASDLCQTLCDCLGCADSQESECVDDIESALEQADDAGCGSEFEAYVDCVASSFTCEDTSIDSVEECFDERDAVLSCGGAQEPQPEGPRDEPTEP